MQCKIWDIQVPVCMFVFIQPVCIEALRYNGLSKRTVSVGQQFKSKDERTTSEVLSFHFTINKGLESQNSDSIT